MKIYCYWTFIFLSLNFGSLYLGILGFKIEQYFARWISAYLIYSNLQAVCLFSLFASLKYFLESYSATTEMPRKELNGHQF